MTEEVRKVDAVSRRIDRLAAKVDPYDHLLAAAIIFGRGGMPFPVGMIVSGVTIYGALSSPERTAERLEAAKTQAINGLFGEDSELHKALPDVFVRAATAMTEAEEADRATIERYPEDAGIDDFSDEDYRALIRMQAPLGILDIADARILVSGEWTEIGAIRVNVQQVGAWWALNTQHGVNLTFNRANSPPEP